MTPAAVLLHGFTGSAASWDDDSLAALRKAGYRPAAIDLPGHGEEAIGYSEPTLESALELVDGAMGSGPGAVVGYSMGGRIGLHYAASHPERVSRLVLESASPGLRTPEARLARRASDEAIAARLFADGIEPFVTFWEAQPVFASQQRMNPGMRAALRRRRMRNDPGALGAALKGLGAGALPSLWSRLETIETPTLLLAGELDPKFVQIATEMHAAMPNSELVVVPDAGHAVHLEAPSAWRRAVGAFLTEG